MLCHAQLKFPDRLPVATNVQYYNQLIASFVLIEKPMYTIYWQSFPAIVKHVPAKVFLIDTGFVIEASTTDFKTKPLKWIPLESKDCV